jgi:thiamine biosynthesis lipoprotein
MNVGGRAPGNDVGQPAVTRRNFLRAACLGGLGLAAGGLTPLLIPEARAGRSERRVSQTRAALGTFVTLIVMSDSRDRVEEALASTWQEIDRLTAVFSRYDPATPLSALNERGLLRDPPLELTTVLRAAAGLHRASGGAFDVSVAPVVDLLRRTAFGRGGGPSGRELQRALTLIDARRIRLDRGAVRLLAPGMRLTLDGIAKGFIADRVSALLTGRGLPCHLIEAGGDIRVGGPKGGRQPWMIGVRDPSAPDRFGDVIPLRRGAAATSGSYESFYDCARRFHHLIDPARGVSPRELVSLTVLAPTAVLADALATAVFVLGPGAGRTLIETVPGGAWLALNRHGQWIKSAGWPGRAG